LKFEDIEPDMRVKHSAGPGYTAVVLSKSHATFRVHFDVDPPSWDTLYDSSEASKFEPEGSFVDTRRGCVFFQNSEPEPAPTKIPDSEPIGDEEKWIDPGEHSSFVYTTEEEVNAWKDGWNDRAGFRGENNEPETIEQTARRLVHGERDQSYDNPRGNFHRIANIWEGILDIRVSEEQVALCMTGVKIARLAHDPQNHDSKVDAIGYVLCLDWLGEGE
jgi:hypothetical protein